MVFRKKDRECVGAAYFQIGITIFSAAVSFAATASIFLAADPTGDDVGRTSHPWADPNRFHGAVQGTGAAFHAAVFIHQAGLFIVHDEHPVSTMAAKATAAWAGMALRISLSTPVGDVKGVDPVKFMVR